MNAKVPLLLFLCTLLSIQILAQQIQQEYRPVVVANPRITAMAVQSDGKIIVAGNIIAVGNSPVNGITRLNADGTQDESFKPMLTPVSYAHIHSLLVSSNGKILVAGYISENLYMIRLNPDGSIDTSFNMLTQIKDISRVVALPNNRYLVMASPPPKAYTIVNNDGSIDPAFNAGTGPNSFGINGNDMAVQADGKIIISGGFDSFSNTPVPRIVRLNTDGSIDGTFAVGTGATGPGFPFIGSIAIQADGKIILAGSFDSFNNVSAKNIVRLLPNGTIDPTFILPGPAANFFTGQISKVALFENGIIASSFRVNQGLFEYAILKLNNDGSLDPTFNIPITDFDLSSHGVVDDPILRVHQNKIVWSGYFTRVGSTPRTAIAQLQSNGIVDQGFNPVLGGLAEIRTVKVQSDGKVLLGGKFDRVGSLKVKNLARLHPDGTPDIAFQTNLGTGADGIINAIQIEASGKILVGGSGASFNGSNTGMLFRLNSNGTLDPTFTNNISIKYVGVGINAIELLPDDKILVGGVFDFVNNTAVSNLVGLNKDGSINASFNNQLLPASKVVFTIAKQSNNDLLVGGEVWLDHTSGFLLRANQYGTALENFSTLDLSNQAIHVIAVLPNDNFVAGGNFSSLFYENVPTPLLQFDKLGLLLDKISIGAYGGGFFDINIVSSDEILLTGDFRKINSINSSGFAVVKLNGAVSSASGFAINGPLKAVCRYEANKNRFYLGGPFSIINDQNFFNLAKVDLDVPLAPKNLTGTQDDVNGRITLTWVDQSFNETGFEVFRGTGSDFSSISRISLNKTSFIDSTALPLNVYSYKVRAINLNESSAYSGTASVSTQTWIPPTAPTNLRHEIAADYSASTISWTDSSPNETGFELEQSKDKGSFVLLKKLEKNSTSFTNAFELDTQFGYRIRAFNKFGKSDYSPVLDLPVIVGIEDDLLSNFSLYPNPAQDKVRLENRSGKEILLTLHGTNGQLYHRQIHSGIMIELNVSHLPSGLYIIRAFLNDRESVHKLVKE